MRLFRLILGQNRLGILLCSLFFLASPPLGRASHGTFLIGQSMGDRCRSARIFPGAGGIAEDDPALCHLSARLGRSGGWHQSPLPRLPSRADADRSRRQLALAGQVAVAPSRWFHGGTGSNMRNRSLFAGLFHRRRSGLRLGRIPLPFNESAGAFLPLHLWTLHNWSKLV